MDINTPVQYLKGVGPKMAPKLARLGIKTIGDLVYYFPRTWQDFNHSTLINHTRIGEQVVAHAKIISISNNRSFKKRMMVTRAKIEDQEGNTINAVWFNQPFLIKNLHVGDEWIFFGKIDYNWQQKEKILQSPILEKNFGIYPIYSETEGVTSKYLRKLIQTALSPLSLAEFLPDQILQSEKLIGLNQAIHEIHFPQSQKTLFQAKTRLGFDELFIIILKMLLAKKSNQQNGAPTMTVKKDILLQFTKSLPFEPTLAQRKASWEIIQDTTKPFPMNRILQGDVGSGKTLVALIAALNTVNNSYQVAWMAPTEILARQHYETTCKLLKDFEVKVALVTSNQVTSNLEENLKIKTKNEKLKTTIKNSKLDTKKLQANKLITDCDIIIGTHSLIQDKIQFDNLGLVIIDEQHRFGVHQRAKLLSRSATRSVPHFLSMTATPIPRTLALTVFGDLEISLLDQMPTGRKPIITKLVDPIDRAKAYEFIKKEIFQGRQAFVICPLIETQNEKLKSKNTNLKLKTINLLEVERKSVKAEYDKLSKEVFPNLKIGLLHGKLKAQEKEKTMQDFKDKKIDIIVSTSVIEVGVDVPNATIMMIEDSDRFGLAQLHQFRGRVGRGEYQSYCLLFTNNLSPETQKRLRTLTEYSDGAKLAQMDLEMRGPGELIGANQSGFANLKIANLSDIMLIKQVRSCVEKLIDLDINKFPALNNKLNELDSQKHFE